MDPEKIRQEAERERMRDSWKSESRKGRKSGKSFRPSSADSWHVYNRIYPGSFNIFIWVFLMLTLGIIGVMVYWLDKTQPVWVLYGGLFFIGVFLARLAVHWLIKIARFGAYTRWRKTLPFTLHGWGKLGQSPNFPRNLYWQLESSVTVQLKQSAPADVRELVKDALFLFTKKANSWFYAADGVQAGFANDPRMKWQLTSAQSVAGSSDSGVAGEIYRLVNGHLRSIASTYGMIESVTVRWESLYKIEAISAD
jgi:hypothetical protein